MNDVAEIFDARHDFEESQRVVIGISHDGLNQIADILVNPNESGRMVYLSGMAEAHPSRLISLAISEKVQPTAMEERGFACLRSLTTFRR